MIRGKRNFSLVAALAGCIVFYGSGCGDAPRDAVEPVVEAPKVAPPAARSDADDARRDANSEPVVGWIGGANPNKDRAAAAPDPDSRPPAEGRDNPGLPGSDPTREAAPGAKKNPTATPTLAGTDGPEKQQKQNGQQGDPNQAGPRRDDKPADEKAEADAQGRIKEDNKNVGSGEKLGKAAGGALGDPSQTGQSAAKTEQPNGKSDLTTGPGAGAAGNIEPAKPETKLAESGGGAANPPVPAPRPGEPPAGPPANERRNDRERQDGLKRMEEEAAKQKALELNLLQQEFANALPMRRGSLRGGGKELDRIEKEQLYRFGGRALEAKATANARKVWHRDARRPAAARVYLGDGNSLEMVTIDVRTVVEGPRARTVVDHVFFNPHDRRLEGTFEYPLPAGASPAFFAMFEADKLPGQQAARVVFARKGSKLPGLPANAVVIDTAEPALPALPGWGAAKAARVVGRQTALETYEEVVHSKVDPGLLEYAGGNTFSGRVFPILPKGFNRIILAYEELLPFTAAGQAWRFALPDVKLQRLSLTVSARAGELAEHAFDLGGTARPAAVAVDGLVTYSADWKDRGPGGEARLTMVPRDATVQAISGRHGAEGPLHVYARLRPTLPVERAAAWSDTAVFLLDTSASESPDRFDVSMRLMNAILMTDADIKRFHIIAFDTSARRLSPDGFANDAAGRAAALKALDGILLEGATDFSAALAELNRLDIVAGSHVNVFVMSDGQVTWGDTSAAPAVARFEAGCRFEPRFHCWRIGLGAENLELFEALTRKGGGVFTCHGEADLPAAASAHRRDCLNVTSVKFVGGPAVSDVLVAGRRSAVYPGGELVVAAKATEAGRTAIEVEGTFRGQKTTVRCEFDVDGSSTLAARGWGEVAVASLLALDDPALEPAVTAYCQEFGIGSRVASFLVLDNEGEWKRLNLDKERAATIAGDLGAYLEGAYRTATIALGAKDAFARIADKAANRLKMEGERGRHFAALMALLSDADFELPAAAAGKPTYRKDVAKTYADAIPSDPRGTDVYVIEAARRNAAGDVDGAVRALSNIVERRPGRDDALRMVGYRLLDMGRPAPAAGLFLRVLANRPFEPHGWRDFARGLEDLGKVGAAAAQYEVVLAGTWHARFGDAVAAVAREEYVRMMRQAVRSNAVAGELRKQFGSRLEQLASEGGEDDLRVSITWNTDGTDVDLWIIEPDGTKCFYSHAKTANGGELSTDMTAGYGPERYRIRKAKPGVYKVIAHYFSPNPNLVGGETSVNVTVTRFADSAREESTRKTVILKRDDEQAAVAEVRF